MGPAWKCVPWRQADGLLQEGEFRVVEAEDLVHYMGLGLHSQTEHSNGPATLCPEKDLRRRACDGFLSLIIIPQDEKTKRDIVRDASVSAR